MPGDRVTRYRKPFTAWLQGGLRYELQGGHNDGSAVVTDDPEVTMAFPPGHFYSPIPDLAEVRARHDFIFAQPTSLAGIDLRASAQLNLAHVLSTFAADQPFSDHPVEGLRYGFVNDFFSYGDGIVLHTMLRHLRPKRYVEIGSGWSSALALDTIDRFLPGATRCTFIEPYPDRLKGLLRDTDSARSDIEVLDVPLHEVGSEVFESLQPGDVLFIDSTHVSRVGSDVNQIFFDVLPILPPGVHVHIHDVFWPFEYPPAWVYDGRAWSENYLLRAYLTHNPRIQINWFSQFLAVFHQAEVAAALPLWQRNTGGSIWLQTVAPPPHDHSQNDRA